MHYTRMLLLLALLCSMCGLSVSAQTTQCGPEQELDSTGFSGTAFFNYGSHARLNSQKYRSAVAVGQTFVGYLDGLHYNSTVGFYSRYLLAPFALKVKATQGDLLDRIQLSWEIDALGPSPNDGFNIYRDGIFLATVGSNIRNYNDFNVIPGIPYTYTVSGLNVYGEGVASSALGFQIPNGVVTGWVRTQNGNPVPDALITLMPMQGFSAKFGTLDGAFAPIDTSGKPLMPATGSWTMTFWIKTDAATANAGLIQLAPFPLYIRAQNSASGHEGVDVSTTQTGVSFLSGTFADSTKNGWHHVALSFDADGGQGRLYIDGVLAALAPMLAVPFADELNLGSRSGLGGWAGRLDELRIYHKQLDELDFREVMEGTASTLTPDLSHYWKMDEGQGEKSYDIMQRRRLYFCGAAFDAQRPPVRTSGKTNAQGYYRIESASYGTGTTFLAEPSKDFYMHRSLKFVRNEADYATLSDFPVTPKATLEIWVNSAGPNGEQCLLSKQWAGNDFRLLLKQSGLNSQVWLYFNGQEHNFGVLGMGYQHLAFTMSNSGGSNTVTAYKNGVAFGTPHTFSGVNGDWSDPAQQWILGARPSGGSYTDHFGGLVDEVALYDTTLSVSAILGHFQNFRDIQEKGLRVYFPLDEGSGSSLGNVGSSLTDAGKTFGASWSTFAGKQETTPHEFTPVTRQVTLNPSVTSVDQVDFVDHSTVAVSGYVRYQGTDCFAKDVEILVNGQSFTPKILTDSIGKFVIDFDPGTTATLTPKLSDHAFFPPNWQVTNVINPIAGILFYDTEKRKIKGQVAGGLCKASILANPGTPSGTVCRVKLSSKNGCLERIITLTDEDGRFEFPDLPPMEMIVSVIEHSDPVVKTAFQVLGGSQVNLTDRDTTLEFLYFAQPEIQVTTGLEPYSPTCNTIVLDQYTNELIELKLVEKYYGSGVTVCPLDTGSFYIIDGLTAKISDTIVPLSNGKALYTSKIGSPNPTPPYLKTIQFVGKTIQGNESSLVMQALVTGVREKQHTFTTITPEIPLLVLHDPPGDGSYSYLEKDSSVCMNMGLGTMTEDGIGGAGNFNLVPTFEWDAGPFGPTTTLLIIGGGSTSFSTTTRYVNNQNMEVCLTATQRISTSGEELIVGGAQGGDVYMGGAFNITFGNADKVTFNDTICEPMLTQIVVVDADSFATTYMYSEWYIKTQVMSHLTNIVNGIKNDPAQTQSDTLKYVKALQKWQEIIAQNKLNIKNAKPVRNLSFDAGVEYEYAERSDTANTMANTTEIIDMSEIAGHYGAYVNNLGADGSLILSFNQLSGTSSTNNSKTGVTTGYVLKDNDPGDGYSIDIGIDTMYKTPAFNIRAGQSTCPWEPGTAKREGVVLTTVDGSTRVDVPANEAAVFHLVMGNTSATNETFTYGFTAGPESNVNGAKIFCNGAPMNVIQYYAIPYGTSIPVTVTVERTEAYDYDSMEIVLYSVCEDLRANAIGILPDTAENLYSAIYLSVHFIKPCSEVEINVPEEGWVIHPDNDPDDENILRITLSKYDTANVDLERIRVQFRRSNGDGAWINAGPDILKADLGPFFTQFYWNTAGLQDGDYEIRAVAICLGDASDKPGYSHIIHGRIERQPPSLIGTPEPSDGVLQVGDEISFSFNKSINCSKLIQADQINKNNVGLYDATTNKLIDANITCFNNRIIIDPLFQNRFYENHILRAELHNIQDLIGNVLVETDWEFYVDRNELAWLTDSLGMTKYEDQTKTATANIHNRGGAPVPFTITGVPDWVHVVPNQGTLAPNEIRAVTFTVDSSLAFGTWSDSITLHTETGQNPFFMGGDEGLPFGVRVVCRPPNWELNAGIFENSENMVLELNIQGVVSTDVEDMVVAFIGDTVCGRARVQYVPQTGKYLAYLTIYGNPTHILDPIRLEIWDASACLRYAVIEDYFTFQPDNVIGNPINPQVIHTSGYILRDVALNYGWNWLSFNLDFPDPDLDAALISLKHPENDLMKGQNAFSIYLNGGGWLGSLDTLGNKSMYIYRASQPDTLKMLGNLIDPATTSIPLVSGWNWIGYIPNYSLPINDALSSVTAHTGDLIKSQLSFAQYINPQFGWIGNLKYMQAPNGYQLKLSSAGTLVYPPAVTNLNGGGGNSKMADDRGGPSTVNFWNVDPTQYEYSMTLIGMFRLNGVNATSATMELGVFAGAEARGSAQAIYVAPLDAYLFFLTSYSNTSGEQLRYKLYDSNNGAVQELSEVMYFSPDLHQGSVEIPIPFTLTSTGTSDLSDVQMFDVQPNPFHSETTLRFTLSKSQEILLTVTDINGKAVSNVRTAAHGGLNTMGWKGQADNGAQLASGVYFVRLQTESGSVVRKIVLQ